MRSGVGHERFDLLHGLDHGSHVVVVGEAEAAATAACCSRRGRRAGRLADNAHRAALRRQQVEIGPHRRHLLLDGPFKKPQRVPARHAGKPVAPERRLQGRGVRGKLVADLYARETNARCVAEALLERDVGSEVAVVVVRPRDGVGSVADYRYSLRSAPGRRGRVRSGCHGLPRLTKSRTGQATARGVRPATRQAGDRGFAPAPAAPPGLAAARRNGVRLVPPASTFPAGSLRMGHGCAGIHRTPRALGR